MSSAQFQVLKFGGVVRGLSTAAPRFSVGLADPEDLALALGQAVRMAA